MQRRVSRCSEWRKRRDPHIFALQREFSGFSVSGFVAAARNFLTATARCCPPYDKCTRCSEKESRCSGYDLPSPMLASLPTMPNFFATAVIQGLHPKISNFFFFLLLGKPRCSVDFLRYSEGPLLFSCLACSLQREGISLQWLASTFSCYFFLVVVRLDFAATVSLYHFLGLLGSLVHCSKSQTRCSYWSLPFLV